MQSRGTASSREKAYENIDVKGVDADNQNFLLLPECFLTFHGEIEHRLGLLGVGLFLNKMSKFQSCLREHLYSTYQMVLSSLPNNNFLLD